MYLKVAMYACFLLIPGAARAQQTPGTEQQQQMIAADRAVFEAFSTPATAGPKLEKLLAPEYSEVEYGRIYPRATVIGQLPEIAAFTFTYSDPVAVATSPDAGYVVATVRNKYSNGAQRDWHFVKSTTVLERRKGVWMSVLHVEEPMLYDREGIIAKPEDSNPALIGMRKLAGEVVAAVKIPGYAPFPCFPVALDAGPGVSYSDLAGAHEANFAELPPPMQHVWDQWAGYTKDEPSGEALFRDMFYRFFMVHELGHLIATRVIYGLPDTERDWVLANMNANETEREMIPNRLAVAWFREHDPAYLAGLVADFRLIEAKLPSPVPAGQDPGRYFTANYAKLGKDPMAYGWYQLHMVIAAYEEPAKTFEQTLDNLPHVQYTEE